jgi:hypothetical protein
MKHAASQIALTAVLVTVGCVAQAAHAQTNESWGGQGSASSWRAASTKATGASAGSIATGAESSWTAGKGSVAAHGEPGGVWSDGSTLSATTGPATVSKSAAGTGSPTKPVGLMRLGTMPSKRPIVTAPAKGQPAGRSGGLRTTSVAKSANGPQFGPGKIGGGARRTSIGRSGASSRGGQLGASSHSSSTISSHGLETPMQSDSTLKGLNGTMPSETPGSELQSPLQNPSH